MYKQRVEEETKAAAGAALKHLIICYALFEYLTSGFDAASIIYSAHLRPLNSLLSPHDGEELWESYPFPTFSKLAQV